MKNCIIAIVCLVVGFTAGRIDEVSHVRAECDTRVAEAIQDTSDATLEACERKIDEITAAGHNECLEQF